MAKVKAALLAIAWVAGATVLAGGLGYVPGALKLVDDYRWGRLVGGLMLPTVLAFLVAGVLMAVGKRRPALWLTGMVLAGYVVLDGLAIVGRISQPASPAGAGVSHQE